MNHYLTRENCGSAVGLTRKLFSRLISRASGSAPAKFQRFNARKNIFKFGVEWRWAEKMGVFQPKTSPISLTLRDRAKISIEH